MRKLVLQNIASGCPGNEGEKARCLMPKPISKNGALPPEIVADHLLW